jgi:predicted phage terminase large subunit-like protein
MDDEDPYPWEILRLPALAEPTEDEPDPLGRLEGEVLCAERYDAVSVHSAMADAGPYLSAGMFQQRPAAREGTMFRTGRWGDVSAIPSDVRLLVRWWDLAATEGAGDFTAGVLVAVGSDGFVYIVDVAHGQWAPDDVERNFLATTVADRDRYGNRVHTVIEQEPAASGKIVAQGWVRKVGGRAEAKPNSGDKEVRATPLSAQQLAGNVRLVRDLNAERPSWWDSLIGEATLFPNGRNDDIIDGAASAYNYIIARPRPTRARAKSAADVSLGPSR